MHEHDGYAAECPFCEMPLDPVMYWPMFGHEWCSNHCFLCDSCLCGNGSF